MTKGAAISFVCNNGNVLSCGVDCTFEERYQMRSFSWLVTNSTETVIVRNKRTAYLHTQVMAN